MAFSLLFSVAEGVSYTSTADCPCTIITSDNKNRARINAMRYFLRKLDCEGKQDELLWVDPCVVRTVEEGMGVED